MKVPKVLVSAPLIISALFSGCVADYSFGTSVPAVVGAGGQGNGGSSSGSGSDGSNPGTSNNPISSPSSSPSPNGDCLPVNGALAAFSSSDVNISGSGEVGGQVILFANSSLTASGNAKIDGGVLKDILGTSIAVNGNASIGTVTSLNLAQLQASIIQLSLKYSLMSATQSFSNLTGDNAIAGNGKVNVIAVSGDINLSGNESLTLEGSASDVFIINVSGQISLSGNANIALQGGVPPNNVVFNNIGAGCEMDLSGNGSISGSFLGVQRPSMISGNGNLNGSVFAQGAISVTGNGLVLTAAPYCPAIEYQPGYSPD